MPLPQPVAGLIIRYSYLWYREHLEGRDEGQKDRPCAIVAAVRVDENGDTRALVLPITHSPPTTLPSPSNFPPRSKTGCNSTMPARGSSFPNGTSSSGLAPISGDSGGDGCLRCLRNAAARAVRNHPRQIPHHRQRGQSSPSAAHLIALNKFAGCHARIASRYMRASRGLLSKQR